MCVCVCIQEEENICENNSLWFPRVNKKNVSEINMKEMNWKRLVTIQYCFNSYWIWKTLHWVACEVLERKNCFCVFVKYKYTKTASTSNKNHKWISLRLSHEAFQRKRERYSCAIASGLLEIHYGNNKKKTPLH